MKRLSQQQQIAEDEEICCIDYFKYQNFYEKGLTSHEKGLTSHEKDPPYWRRKEK